MIAVCNYFNDEIKNSNKIIYLDAVQDPGNVGTILRTSLAFSYFNIILGKGSASKYNSKVISASQGAIFNINTEIGDVETLLNLKKQGYKIISTLLDKDATKLDDLKISKDEKVIFVFGNEGQGISDEIKNISDDKVFIEMKNIDSLNVGVAASILMYKFSEK